MLTIELARQLSDSGLAWEPRSGDRFVVSVKGMEEDVFVISEITVDVHHFKTGDIIGFNGTTEWALDSTPADDVVWLPLEHQLRGLLGDRFLALARVPEGWAVTLTDGTVHLASDPEDAYALALLG